MGGWRKYLELQLQAKSGLNSALVVGALIGLLSAAVTFVFLLVAAFIWLARKYDPLIAGLALGGIFLLITILALGYALWSQRRTAQRARLALVSRRSTSWLDPKLLAGALQVSRAIGLRKMIPLLAIGVLAAGAAMQLGGRERPDPPVGAV
jgi:hypothetical protein